MTLAPPGGEGKDIVVNGGSGYGRADAAWVESAPVTSAPDSSAAAQARCERFGLRRDLLNPRTVKGL
ncbi:hypothetical protein [Streptomyces sp. NPDC005865]|uniref:hypothetical protein n=1 Tax=Streptomyces sp. NPDC005865 TaxID=3155453 RepID=UPI0033EF508E